MPTILLLLCGLLFARHDAIRNPKWHTIIPWPDKKISLLFVKNNKSGITDFERVGSLVNPQRIPTRERSSKMFGSVLSPSISNNRFQSILFEKIIIDEKIFNRLIAGKAYLANDFPALPNLLSSVNDRIAEKTSDSHDHGWFQGSVCRGAIMIASCSSLIVATAVKATVVCSYTILAIVVGCALILLRIGWSTLCPSMKLKSPRSKKKKYLHNQMSVPSNGRELQRPRRRTAATAKATKSWSLTFLFLLLFVSEELIVMVNGIDALPNGHENCGTASERKPTDLCGIVDIWIAGTYGAPTTAQTDAKAVLVSKYGEIAEWDDFSQVTTMHSLFRGKAAFNGDISKWNFNNVESMSHSKSLVKV